MIILEVASNYTETWDSGIIFASTTQCKFKSFRAEVHCSFFLPGCPNNIHSFGIYFLFSHPVRVLSAGDKFSFPSYENALTSLIPWVEFSLVREFMSDSSFLSAVNNVIPLPRSLPGFWLEVHIIQIVFFPLTGKALFLCCCFQGVFIFSLGKFDDDDMPLAQISLGLYLLGFIQLLESIGLSLLPNLDHYFFDYPLISFPSGAPSMAEMLDLLLYTTSS